VTCQEDAGAQQNQKGYPGIPQGVTTSLRVWLRV
jgi:hypothetical protein